MSEDHWAARFKGAVNDFIDRLHAFLAADDDEYIGTGNYGELDADIRIIVKIKMK